LTTKLARSQSGDESDSKDDAVEEVGFHSEPRSAILKDAISRLRVFV
jgi:hypothetical protein